MSEKQNKSVGTDVTTSAAAQSAVVAETPKPATTAPLLKKETVTKKTAVNDRRFKLIKEPSMAFKGRQRQIVIEVLKTAKEPMSGDEIAIPAATLGLQATAGVAASVKWHLHHLVLMGYVECVNPQTTIEVERPFTPAEAMALSK